MIDINIDIGVPYPIVVNAPDIVTIRGSVAWNYAVHVVLRAVGIGNGLQYWNRNQSTTHQRQLTDLRKLAVAAVFYEVAHCH